MFGALDISTSALVAQRTRMNVIAANMANMNTTHDADGNYSPFQRRIAILAAGDPQNQSKMGVHVREVMLDDAPFRKVHLPNHPNADADGNVNFPNIDSSMEMINALEASRAYEANITAAEATKSMLNAALQLLA